MAYREELGPKMFDFLYLGITIGQPYAFYGSTWAAHMMGAGHIPGVTLMQACSTSTTCIFQGLPPLKL